MYITARQVPTKPVRIFLHRGQRGRIVDGVIVLQPPALTTSNSVPKAENITAQVRTEGIVSVDVLDHVTYSDGTTVSLQNDLQYDKNTFKGLVFVSGDTVRYQATRQTGSFPVTYTVKDNLGNAASATITINVHQKDASNKAAPTPPDVEAQVAAGQKVQIPITLTGIDADGDDVQLLGLGNKAPKLGRISEVGATYLVYEAYADSSGTDTFSYAVEDWTGQSHRAGACGRVQIRSRFGCVRRDDEITLRPNTAATVPVAQNDISGDNTDLTVSKDVESQGIGGIRSLTTCCRSPRRSRRPRIRGLHRQGQGRPVRFGDLHGKRGFENAAIEPPTAYDYRVPSAATIDKKSVDVDVSQWIANPSGTADELQVGVHPSASAHAHVKGGKHSTIITVDLTVTGASRALHRHEYDVRHHVHRVHPGTGLWCLSAPLRPKAPELKVNSRETIEININDYVRVGAGKEPYIESADSVSATKASNSDFYVNDKTLKFTAAKDYAGPASITFTAVDGKRDKNDKAKIINSAVITLPITVIGRDVPPPTFSSSTIDVEAGADPKTVDLTALTHAPSGVYDDEKQYTYSGGSHRPGESPLTCPVPAACRFPPPRMPLLAPPRPFPCKSHTARAP